MTREEALDRILAENKTSYILNIPSVRDAVAEFFRDAIDELVGERRYNMVFSLSFSLDTDFSPEDWDTLPVDQLEPVERIHEAIDRRIDDIKAEGLGIYEAIGLPDNVCDNED